MHMFVGRRTCSAKDPQDPKNGVCPFCRVSEACPVRLNLSKLESLSKAQDHRASALAALDACDTKSVVGTKTEGNLGFRLVAGTRNSPQVEGGGNVIKGAQSTIQFLRVG